ncbi:MAG: GGDEF domain-containing protein [Solirubrobacterales bacterium]|nr:GGDEF domain-containing protein [Solirubrobacterales bacterium]
MPILPPRRRRPRAIPDAPVDELLVHSEELTKGWLLSLLEESPLAQAGSILTEDLPRDGPRLCEAVLRAVASDTDLRRLESGGALEMLASSAGQIAGAVDPESISHVVDALAGVIWSALRESVRRPEPDELAQLLERLGLVMELVRGAALRAGVGGGVASAGRRVSALKPAVVAASESPESLESAGLSAEASRTSDFDVSSEPLWVGAVRDEIARAESADAPLSLLLVELEDADRVSAIEGEAAATGTFGRFAQGVRSVLRRQDILACESDRRAWIVAPETGRLGAQALGARIVAAVRSSPPWRGAPLSVSVGVAVFEEDGRDHDSLIEAAEESRFAAEARGVGVDAEEQAAGPPEPESEG